MEIRLQVNYKDGEKHYVGNEKGIVFSDKEHSLVWNDEEGLYLYLHKNRKELRKIVQEEKTSLEIVGLPPHDDITTTEDENIYLLGLINTTKEELKKEAVKRLKNLKLESMALKDYRDNDVFYVSERMGGIPFNYFLPGYTYEKEVREAIEKVKEAGYFPYFAIVDHTEFGLWISVLFITPDKRVWENVRPDKNGIVYSAVYNETGDVDWGDIQIRPMFGGILRTA